MSLQYASGDAPRQLTADELMFFGTPLAQLTSADDFDLINKGYEPIPVRGKAPVALRWQEGRITQERIGDDRDAHPDAVSTGIRTGRVVAVDIDILKPDEVAAIEQLADDMLGRSPLRRVGRKGCVLAYRNETPIAKITAAARIGSKYTEVKVEILGTGNQFVAYGIHPDTGRPYEWTRTDGDGGIGQPLTVPAADLPEVTPDKLIAFADAAVDLLKAKFGYLESRVSGVPKLAVTTNAKGERVVRVERGNRFTTGDTPMWEADFVRMIGRVECDTPRPEWVANAASFRSAPVARLKEGGTYELLSEDELYQLFLEWSQGKYDYLGRYKAAPPASYSTASDPSAPTGDDAAHQVFWSLKAARDDAHNRTIRSLIKAAQDNGYTGATSIHDSDVGKLSPEEAFKHIAGELGTGGDKPSSHQPPKPDGLVVITGADIKPKKLQWLWRDWIARSVLTMAAGPPETGKTSCAISFAATISVGGKWPDGTDAEQGDVILWLGEDLAEETVATRFLACNGDRSRLHIVKGVREGEATRPFDPAEDMQKLHDYTRANTPNLGLVVIEPIVIVVRGDSHKNAESRRGLQKVVALAETLAVAVLGITHYSKGTQGKLPLERVTGSLAFGAAPRTVLGFVMSPDCSKRRMVKTKTNIGPGGGGFDYALSRVPVDVGEGETEEGQRVEWGAAVFGSPGRLVSQIEGDGEKEPAAPVNATMWLRELLAGGEVEVRHVKQAVTASGHSWRTVVRAKSALGVISEQRGFGEDHWWVWKLPPPGAATLDAETVPF